MSSKIEACTPVVDFSSIPIVDYALLSSPSTRPIFISQLRHALVNVGFLYLCNHPIQSATVDTLISYFPKLFDLPQEEKAKLRMINSPHFLGYSGLGEELTKGVVDHKEVFFFGTQYEPKNAGENEELPDYWRMYGEPLWPDERLIPGFHEATRDYLKQLTELSYIFTSLLAEALGLAPDTFVKFFHHPENIQHRASFLKYPVVTDDKTSGLGAHYDSGFLIFLLQASSHRGLQVQTLRGNWIDVPPIPGSLVVNIGKALEFVTQGLARATYHRVLSPRGGPGEPETPRFSLPFFQNFSPDICLVDNVLEFPPEVLALKRARELVSTTEDVDTLGYGREPAGRVKLNGRIKSHPDIAERHYPDLFKKYFPDGMPKQFA